MSNAASGLRISASRQFPDWLAEQRVSLALTTYQAGKLMLVGLTPDGAPAIFERTFARSMGLAADPCAQTLWLATLFQLWRFENALAPGQVFDGHDRLYVPRVGYTTGDLDVHDLAIAAGGRPLFVNTLFSCLATVSETHSFEPVWKPNFISRLAAEDRCHLNGLAMADGHPAYVTAVARADVADGWRDFRVGGGVVVDVQSGEVAAAGLCMPHSPRLYRERLYLLDSGSGRFGTLDAASGTFDEIAFCAGYLRGLAFVGDFAVAGTSRCRDQRTFSGLPLDEALSSRGAEARCAILVIDLRRGDVVHWLRLEGAVSELYDVAVLPGVVRPSALGFKSDDIRRVLTTPDAAVAPADLG